MNTPSSGAEMCECGHSVANHHGENNPDAAGPCHATVYTTVPHGMNAHRCRCGKFTPLSGAIEPLATKATR